MVEVRQKGVCPHSETHRQCVDPFIAILTSIICMNRGNHFCSSIDRKTPSKRVRLGTIKGSTRWHVLLMWKSLGVRTELDEASSREELRGIFVCLQSSERADVKRRSQFG